MNRIRELRKKKNLTMKDLGDAIGVAESTVSLYETGKRQPDQETLLLLANFFHVSLDYLVGRINNEKPTAIGDGLDRELIDLMSGLSPQEVQRVRDFVAGLIASRAK